MGDDRPDEGVTNERRPRSWFFVARVLVLSTILLAVVLYAWTDVRSREARTEWKRPLIVAFVIVREGSVPDSAVATMRVRSEALELRLREEMARYKKADFAPFDIALFGPVDLTDPTPVAPDEVGIVSAVRFQWELNRWVSRVDERVGIPARGFDARIYVVVRPPASKKVAFVEGMSEDGGRVGVVRVELNDAMADLALFVATHELFHTLGATDKYGPDGSILTPSGLAEPQLSPLYPQRYAELMARHRALSSGHAAPVKTLDELAVGAMTAQEIGWTE